MYKEFKIGVLAIIFLMTRMIALSQCSCSFTINPTVPAYTISSGQTACLPENMAYTGSITLLGGTLCNYGTLNSPKMIFQAGTINNYKSMVVKGTFSLHPGTTINNNKSFAIETLYNSGTINLSSKALLATVNFYNNNGGVVNGVNSIGGDSTNYSAVFVSNTSENKGSLQKHMVFRDLTYLGTSIYRIDNYYSSIPLIDYSTVRFTLSAGDNGPRGPQFCPYAIDINPNSNISICAGSSVAFNASLLYLSGFLFVNLGAPSNFLWSTSPTQPYGLPSGGNNNFFTVSGAISSFAISASTSYQGCNVVSSPVVVSLSSLIANAGPSIFVPYNQSTSIGNPFPAPVATGGTAPYTYAWSPTTPALYVSGSPSSANPVVKPLATTVFNLSVTDASSGCAATSSMAVIVEQFPHAVLKRNLDGGYYKVTAKNTLFFKYDEEYKNNSSVPLKYKIYKQDHATAAAAISCAALYSTYGDNRFALDLSTGCSPVVTANQFYVLEVINEKNEKFYLKFYY